ncbi:MAG: GyrI-like domain-containing protein [Spirochaetes bacterium]|nr:GyrI-like domain-containing protein [Spirochaetota bacterium]
MKSKTIGIIALIVCVLIIVVGTFMRGPDLKKYDSLLTPRITEIPDTKVVEVAAAGDPNQVGGMAFGLLFKHYYAIKPALRAKFTAPRARWPKSYDTPRKDWIGLFALPLNPAAVPAVITNDGPYSVTITNWKYGTVAEILHRGPYSNETPTVDKLHKFITAQGYVQTGEHEEEYLRGPDIFGKGDPDKYYTIIRCRVQKKGAK